MHLEVWVEKDALLGVVASACEDWRVPHGAMRGDSSDSLVYKAAQRLADAIADDRKALVLHLADHDPGGIKMSLDLQKRLSLYSHYDDIDNLEVWRIGLTMEQVPAIRAATQHRQRNGPQAGSLCAPVSDTRCWELDALTPRVIRGLIDAEICKVYDKAEWDRVEQQESLDRDRLLQLAAEWDARDGEPEPPPKPQVKRVPLVKRKRR